MTTLEILLLCVDRDGIEWGFNCYAKNKEPNLTFCETCWSISVCLTFFWYLDAIFFFRFFRNDDSRKKSVTKETIQWNTIYGAGNIDRKFVLWIIADEKFDFQAEVSLIFSWSGSIRVIFHMALRLSIESVRIYKLYW